MHSMDKFIAFKDMWRVRRGLNCTTYCFLLLLVLVLVLVIVLVIVLVLVLLVLLLLLKHQFK